MEDFIEEPSRRFSMHGADLAIMNLIGEVHPVQGLLVHCIVKTSDSGRESGRVMTLCLKFARLTDGGVLVLDAQIAG